jgi:hypothetical protein
MAVSNILQHTLFIFRLLVVAAVLISCGVDDDKEDVGESLYRYRRRCRRILVVAIESSSRTQ